MKRGAVDFLQKPVSVKPLQTALEHGLAASGERFARQKNVDCYQQLTPKERELALLVVKGLMNREIAEIMNIAVRTVEVHRARVMEKDAGGESGGVSQHLTADYRVILMIPMNEAWRAPGGNKKRRLISEHKNW